MIDRNRWKPLSFIILWSRCVFCCIDTANLTIFFLESASLSNYSKHIFLKGRLWKYFSNLPTFQKGDIQHYPWSVHLSVRPIPLPVFLTFLCIVWRSLTEISNVAFLWINWSCYRENLRWVSFVLLLIELCLCLRSGGGFTTDKLCHGKLRMNIIF
jgi:hypothetical protein